MSTDVFTGGGGLRIRGLHKSYGAFKAVDGIDLDVPEGSFFALLGPSGCGKTTTLRMVAGLEEPTRRLDRDRRHATSPTLRPYQRPVNTVFQSYALFPHLTIFENIAFGLRRRKVDGIDAKVNEMLELVDMRHLAKRKPTQLSGGQQQRIAVVRALVNRPKVLLLDEPLGALDLKLRRQMQLELKRIQTEVGITFIHVTHDQEEAMTMADTIAVLNKGKVEQMGAPVDLYENPATAFVSGFLGQSNLLPATVVGRDGDVITLDSEGFRLAMPASRAHSAGPVGPGRRPSGEDPDRRRGTGSRDGQRHRRHHRRRVVHRGLDPVPGPHPGRRGAVGVLAEHRDHAAQGGRAGLGVLGPGAHLRPRQRCRGRGRSPPRSAS